MNNNNQQNKKIELDNVSVKKREDKNFNTYFIIVNNDNQDEAYFCFERAVKEGWNDLVNNWENVKGVEIEYEEAERGRKVIGVIIH